MFVAASFEKNPVKCDSIFTGKENQCLHKSMASFEKPNIKRNQVLILGTFLVKIYSK